MNLNAYTLEAWVKQTTTGNQRGIFGTTERTIHSSALYYDSGELKKQLGDGTAVVKTFGASDPAPDTEWRYVVATVDWIQGRARLYIDGELAAEADEIGIPQLIASAEKLLIGDDEYGTGSSVSYRRFNGAIDEVRISRGARSADWVKAQYLSMTDNDFIIWRILVDNYFGAQYLGITVATLSGRMLGKVPVDAVPDCYIFWGPEDGGTNRGSWAYSYHMGEYIVPGSTFFTNLYGLSSGTTLYYRVYATNVNHHPGADVEAEAWAIVTTNFTTLIDDDGDGIPDCWETNYWANLTIADETTDSDGDGHLDIWEYWAGTNPTNANEYMRIMDMDLVSEDSDDVRVRMWAGGNRTFLIYAADDPEAPHTLLGRQWNGFLSGETEWHDTGAVQESDRRFYNLGVFFDTGGYTNRDVWAMYRQDRPADEKFLVSPPVDYGSDTNLNLNARLGRELARGLYAGTVEANSDYLSYISADGSYKTIYLYTNATEEGGVYWYDPDTDTQNPDVEITPGMALWVHRRDGTAPRSNAVFLGREFTRSRVAAQPPVEFKPDHGGWNMFGWPLTQPLKHQNTESSGKYSTPAGQLGFWGRALGGEVADLSQTNRIGAQIWVWENNTWMNRYWLVDNGATDERSMQWNGKWWDSRARDFADFQLEAGKGYYFLHPDSALHGEGAATNFVWHPVTSPPEP